MNNGTYKPKYHVPANNAMQELSKYMLVDGFEFVLDTQKSHGSWIHDALSGKDYLDFFTFFASAPIGMNHPKMLDQDFINYIGREALNKPSNSDIYTEAMATFVSTFFKNFVPKHFKYSFFVSGGALAVENALKAAFDWKVRLNFSKGYKEEKGHQVIHFKDAFHGRSGYTMSLTNTDPAKIDLFPKFNWPRVTNPMLKFPITPENLAETIELEKKSIAEIKQAFVDNKDDIAAIIIEPIQAEGGDHHFRPEFLKQLQELAIDNDALLIFDEVQTGGGLTGTFWLHEQLGVEPDIIAFGKKMQVCGILAGERLDTVEDNVFRLSSRINSTWGGNYVDMVRSTKYLEIIEEEKLVDNVNKLAPTFNKNIQELTEKYPQFISNPRGRGFFSAFEMDSHNRRNQFRQKCWDNGLIVLTSGYQSIRFRPALNLSQSEIDKGFEIMNNVLKSL